MAALYVRLKLLAGIVAPVVLLTTTKSPLVKLAETSSENCTSSLCGAVW